MIHRGCRQPQRSGRRSGCRSLCAPAAAAAAHCQPGRSRDRDRKHASERLAAKARAAMVEDGFALQPLRPSDSQDAQTLRSLDALLKTDSAQLGKGKDVQAKFGPYDQLRIARAWKIDHPHNSARYKTGLGRVRADGVPAAHERLRGPHPLNFDDYSP